MASWINGDPKVTQCVILIQEHLNLPNVTKWDSYLMHTSVKKYYIGLGKDDIINNYNLMQSNDKASLSYPLIRVNQRGFVVVKCPTVSGTVFIPGT